ncbi:hypothetical protein BS50DRAFT_122517 [Corynespora cassiicola Philippines]|uniref:Uncharacterized protein n=1 Tax=Corynespora cassiicola Philippines TaxID=1448308 RepID=A0A2T2NAV1_CORCC|nr:hypothetical protein BS50DRAFT_122517 [Corynespora cassiicola Philippines]
MAEGLAVVATISSILQLVDFTLKVADRANHLKSGASDIPKSLNHLKTELPVLRHTLQQIQDAIQEARFSGACTAALKPVVEGCNQSMEEMQSILGKNLPEKGDGKVRMLLKSASSVRNDSKIEGIVQTLRGHVGILTFYFATSSSMNQPLDEKLVEIRRWLSAPDSSVNFRKALELRQANTGQWLLESNVYKQWREKGSFVWLHGIPGCGKTVLSSTVLEDIREYTKDDPGKALAYFYFDFNDQKKQDPEEMVRALVSYLLQQCVRVLPGLDKQFSSHRNRQEKLSLEILLGVLRELIDDFPSTYLVIDALDECGNRRQLMKILKTIFQWQAPGLHVILTSRREADISHTLEGIVDKDSILCIQTGAVDHDIGLYVRQQLEDDQSLQKWKPDDKKLIETALTERSSGMFRLAACRLEILRECRNKRQLKQAISDLPPTLDETYNRILNAIKKSDVDYAVRILRWLAFSTRPLCLNEVAEVAALEADRCLAFDPEEVLEEPLEVLKICSSLVTIRPGGQPWEPPETVALAHYSVKEYLVSDRILESEAKVYSMETILCQQIIAKCCIQYLLQFDEPDSLTDENLHEYALAEYSGHNWTIHSRRSEDLEPVELILQLLELKETACLAWFRLDSFNEDCPESDFTKSLEDVPRPLYLASQTGLVKVVKRLVSDENVDVNETSGEMGNALQAASFEGHQGIVQYLVVNGADVNALGGEHGYALQALHITAI